MKVLISAYACEPNKGSEPGVGWNWVQQISKFAQVWVITRTNNRGPIEEEIHKLSISNINYVYYDVPKWLSFWKKKTHGLYLYYLLWQIGVYYRARTICRINKIDVVHHLTFGNIWLPTFLPFLGQKFIWGPIGGGEQIPKLLRKEYYLKSRVSETLRDFFLNSLKINILFLYTSKKAKIIIAKTKDTANKIPNLYRKKVILTTDVAANHNTVTLSHTHNNHLQIIAIGRLDAWRGFDMLIKAFARIKSVKENKLLILGEGNDKKRLQKICRIEHLENSVMFLGQVKREKYFEYLSSSSIFVNPSLKESGVTVLFDALSYGLPVICLDIPGAPEIINDECGIKIKPISHEQIISDLADALVKLVNNGDLRKRIGETGRMKVLKYYTWNRKGDFIRKIYELVLRHADSSYS